MYLDKLKVVQNSRTFLKKKRKKEKKKKNKKNKSKTINKEIDEIKIISRG